LRVFSQSLDPKAIGDLLGFASTSARPIDPESKYRNRREWGYWGWSTEDRLDSRDNLEHLHAILERLDKKAEKLAHLRTLGCCADIFCFWESSGQGGPYLDVPTLKRLAILELEVSWDLYFCGDSE